MKRGLVWIVVVVLICGLFAFPVGAQGAEIVSITFSNASAVAEENLSLSGYGDKDSGYATSTEGGRIYASVSGTDLRKLEWSKGEYGTEGMQPVMTGGTKNPWGNGAYLEVRVSTAGYTDITFSADIGATNKGPRDYKLQYSTDGSTYKDIAGATFTVTTNKTLFAAFDGVALPADAADREMLYIRIAVASNMLVNGTAGLIGSVGGETAINHVTVSGAPLATTTASTATTIGKSQGTTAASAVTTAVADSPTTTAAKQTIATTPSANTADVSCAMTAVLAFSFGAAITLFAARKRTVK